MRVFAIGVGAGAFRPMPRPIGPRHKKAADKAGAPRSRFSDATPSFRFTPYNRKVITDSPSFTDEALDTLREIIFFQCPLFGGCDIFAHAFRTESRTLGDFLETLIKSNFVEQV